MIKKENIKELLQLMQYSTDDENIYVRRNLRDITARQS